MKMNISEFARLTGVSVRTLHYYDQIGLLKPDFVDSGNGYRFYGETSLEKMQEILFYRELSFSLKTVKEIISSPNYNKQEALREQKKLLILKRERLDKIIKELSRAEKGDEIMDFNVFSNQEIDAYREEAKKRWGETKAYSEQKEKTANYTKENWEAVARGLEKILSEFAQIKREGNNLDSKKTIAQVKKLQDFITETQYTCTNEILASLGEMYIADERFKQNIDKLGIGTAEFISEAIKEYCSRL